MKTILKNTEELMNSISEELEKRIDFYDSRSEKWQDSEKGERYQEITDQLQATMDELENLLNIEN
jgi:hypothetical protein